MRIVVALIVVLIATCGVAVWWWQSGSLLQQSGADRGRASIAADDSSRRVLETKKLVAANDLAIDSTGDVEQGPEAAGEGGEQTKPADSEAASKTDLPDGKNAEPPPENSFFQAALTGEPIPFEDLCFRTTDLLPPTREQLLQWVESVPQQKGSMNEARTRVGVCMVLDGVHRLRAPWGEQRVIRLCIAPQHRWHLYLYHGDTGIALHWDLRQATFVAYVVSRHGDQVLPYRYRLAATDQGRARRTLPRPPVPLDLRYQDQELIVSCGDIAILRCPCRVFRRTCTGMDAARCTA